MTSLPTQSQAQGPDSPPPVFFIYGKSYGVLDFVSINSYVAVRQEGLEKTILRTFWIMICMWMLGSIFDSVAAMASFWSYILIFPIF